jgi:hypothetical protein
VRQYLPLRRSSSHRQQIVLKQACGIPLSRSFLPEFVIYIFQST